MFLVTSFNPGYYFEALENKTKQIWLLVLYEMKDSLVILQNLLGERGSTTKLFGHCKTENGRVIKF